MKEMFVVEEGIPHDLITEYALFAEFEDAKDYFGERLKAVAPCNKIVWTSDTCVEVQTATGTVIHYFQIINKEVQ